LSAYKHGGDLGLARLAYPDVAHPWIDLSTGINPHRWDVQKAQPVDWTALPGVGDLAELEAAAAAHFGVPAQNVATVPGTEIGLRMLSFFALSGPYRYVSPGYSTYAEALRGAARIGADALQSEAAKGGTILLGRPNNPDGLVVRTEQLHAVARALAAQGGKLVIDEAFADVIDEPSLALSLGDRAIALRSFGKFFGLAGLRLGFVIAEAAELGTLRRQLGAWPVNSAAITIGTAAYRDGGWINATRLRLRGDASRLDQLLAGHGLVGCGDCPLFRLVRTADAASLFDRLARRGIWTRPFDYAPDWLRIGLPGNEEAFSRLDEALGCG
jgi:cobalamin biosynthetic protein CobC